MKKTEMLEDAIKFALECHSGMTRKGTAVPYILHPLEALQILTAMNAEVEVMAAGVLHDTLEDTDATICDIYERFGEKVAALVNFNTEDKEKSWYMRKLHTINALETASLPEKMLIMADKLANLRSMYRDYLQVGDDLWLRFNASKEQQAWYYSKICDGLYELQKYKETESLYWEMVGLYKDLFVVYVIDEKKGYIYQLSADEDHWVLKKGNPKWRILQDDVGENGRIVSRREAECLENIWSKEFWDVHRHDMEDVEIILFSSQSQSFSIEIQDAKLIFSGEYFEEGMDEKEFYYKLDEENTHILLVQLRLMYNIRRKISTIVEKEFGGEKGGIRFKEFCDRREIDYQYIVI